jgi:hypothetical protein
VNSIDDVYNLVFPSTSRPLDGTSGRPEDCRSGCFRWDGRGCLRPLRDRTREQSKEKKSRGRMDRAVRAVSDSVVEVSPEVASEGHDGERELLSILISS